MEVRECQCEFEDRRMAAVSEKVLAGERLDRRDGLVLAGTPDLLGVGWLANAVRERRHGNATFYNVNRHLNPTNVCVASCALCAFYVPFRRAADGWVYTVDEAVKTVEDLRAPASGEVLEINYSLEDNAEQVNQEPYGAGWMIKISLEDPAELEQLISPAEYGDLISGD